MINNITSDLTTDYCKRSLSGQVLLLHKCDRSNVIIKLFWFLKELKFSRLTWKASVMKINKYKQNNKNNFHASLLDDFRLKNIIVIA